MRDKRPNFGKSTANREESRTFANCHNRIMPTVTSKYGQQPH